MKTKKIIQIAIFTVIWCVFFFVGSAVGNTYDPVLTQPVCQFNGMVYPGLPDLTEYNVNLSMLTQKIQDQIVAMFLFYFKILMGLIMTGFIAILLKKIRRQSWSVKKNIYKKRSSINWKINRYIHKYLPRKLEA